MSHQEHRRPRNRAPWVAAALAALLPLPALAQNRPPGNDNAGPPGFIGRGGFGRVDPLANVKLEIKASDEEWKVIGPKLRAVANAQQIVEADPTETIATGGPRGGNFGPGGNGAFAGPAGSGGPRGGPGGPGGFGGGGRRGGEGGPPGAGGPVGGGPGGGNTPDDRRPPGPDGQGRQNFVIGGDRGGPGGGPGGAPGGGGFGGRGGPGGGGPGGPGFGRSSPIALAQADLKTALDNPQATPQEIQEKVAAVRKATEKARADLAAARKDLVELLTADQQVILVGLGYLE